MLGVGRFAIVKWPPIMGCVHRSLVLIHDLCGSREGACDQQRTPALGGDHHSEALSAAGPGTYFVGSPDFRAELRRRFAGIRNLPMS